MFGSSTNTGTQQGGGVFGGLGTSNQQNQQQGGGIFGGLGQTTQNQPQQHTGSILGLGQNTQQQQPQQQTGGIFGLGQNNQQQGGGLFGGSTRPGGLFTNSTQQQPLAQPQQNQLGSSLWQPNSGVSPREKSVPDQMASILEQWDTGNPNCAFKYYFYNKVSDDSAPLYRPGPNEDPKKWEEALSKKPGPGFIPVLCTGFAQMGERIKTQQRTLGNFNSRLHEINGSLTALLQRHDTKISIRAMDAKRKHAVLKQRCLALATKVQVLRNRGYAMGGDEEDLKAKLAALDRDISDPALGARAEEIWARMITVQERAKLLKAELEKTGTQSQNILDEETDGKAKKILEDYQTQLVHLKKELDKIQQDYVEWEKDQPGAAKVNGR